MAIYSPISILERAQDAIANGNVQTFGMLTYQAATCAVCNAAHRLIYPISNESDVHRFPLRWTAFHPNPLPMPTPLPSPPGSSTTATFRHLTGLPARSRKGCAQLRTFPTAACRKQKMPATTQRSTT